MMETDVAAAVSSDSLTNVQQQSCPQRPVTCRARHEEGRQPAIPNRAAGGSMHGVVSTALAR